MPQYCVRNQFSVTWPMLYFVLYFRLILIIMSFLFFVVEANILIVMFFFMFDVCCVVC